MAIFASTTTSGYSDPMKAMTIKALEKRQADMMAQNAQQGAITPENTQTPIQGVGHIVNQIAGQMNEGRAMAAVAAQRQALAQTMAGIDWDKGPTSQQVAGLSADPDLMKQVLTQMAENRRAQAQREHETSLQTGRQTFEGGQKEEDRTITRAGQTQTAELERERMAAAEKQAAAQRDLTKSEGTDTRQLTRDMATQEQNARAQQAQLQRELTAAEAEKDRTYKTGDRQAQIAADQKLAEIQGKIGASRDAAKFAADAAEGDKQRSAVRENLHSQLNATKEGQAAKQEFDAAQQKLDFAFKSGDRDKVIAAAAEAAKAQQSVDMELKRLGIAADAAKPASEAGKLKLDETQGKVPEGTFAATQAAKPGDVEKTIALQTQQTQREAIVDELKQAKELLGKGINTGLLKGFDTLRGQIPGGFLGDAEQAQRTEQFDSTMKKVATTNMSTILKGASTNYEMQEFVKQYNNPRVSMEDKRRAFERVLLAAEKDANFGAQAISALPGAQKAAAGGGSAAAAPAADPMEGRTASGPDGTLVRRNGKWEKQ